MSSNSIFNSVFFGPHLIEFNLILHQSPIFLKILLASIYLRKITKVVSFITLVSVEVGPGNKLEDLVCSDKVCATLNLISWAPNYPTGLGNLELIKHLKRIDQHKNL